MKKKLLFILFLTPVLFMGVWLGGGGTLWKLVNGNTLKPALSKWKVDFGTAGMNSDTLAITSGDTFLVYMANDTVKLALKKGSGFLDLTQTTVLFPSGNIYLGSVLPYDSISRIGKSDSAFAYGYYKYLHADSLRTTGNIWAGDSADTVVLDKGSMLMFMKPSLNDTSFIWDDDIYGLHLKTKAAIDLDVGGSIIMYLQSGAIYFYKNLKPNVDNAIDIGASGYKVKNFYIAGSIVDSTGLISGKGTFPATYTCDTFLLSGVSSTDVIQVDWYGATQYNYGLRVTYTTDTIFIYCDVSDTTKARAEGFTYIRYAHRP